MNTTNTTLVGFTLDLFLAALLGLNVGFATQNIFWGTTAFMVTIVLMTR